MSRLKRWLKRNRGERRSPHSAVRPRQDYRGGASFPQQVEQFSCTSEIDQVQHILVWLEGLDLELSAAALWECRIILVEAFTNAVRNAHKNQDDSQTVNLVIEMWPGWLEIQVWDRGSHFDLPVTLEAMRRRNEAEPLRYGSGRGLLLMEKVSDRLVYERRGDRNCLIARKKLNRR